MCNRVLLLFGKMPQWNLYINCNVNGTRFQSSLTFHTGLSSLRVSCKRALRSMGSNINWLPPRDLLQKPDQNHRTGIVEILFAVRHYRKIDKITLTLTSSELTYYQTYTISIKVIVNGDIVICNIHLVEDAITGRLSLRRFATRIIIPGWQIYAESQPL